MVPQKVISYLEKSKIKYETLIHKQVFTAHDLAMTLHIAHKEIAKSLLLKAGSDFFLAILPADRNLDFKKLTKLVKVKKIELPKEQIMKTKFNVKPGALPAFGGLYKLPVFVDKAILPVKKILLASGSFIDSILMSPKDYVKSEQAILGNFSVVKKIKPMKPQKSIKTKKATKNQKSTKQVKKINKKRK
jgi:Ala-tRNA(Pro) deacylase